MIKKILIIGILMLVYPPLVQAQTTVIGPENSPHPYQLWVEEAHIPTPNLSVTITLIPEPGLGLGYAGIVNGEAIILLMPIAGKDTFYHELGHLVDDAFSTEQKEWYDTFLHRPYWYGSGDSTLEDGDEWFADIYSICARVSTIKNQWWLSIGSGTLDGHKVNQICHLIRSY